MMLIKNLLFQSSGAMMEVLLQHLAKMDHLKFGPKMEV